MTPSCRESKPYITEGPNTRELTIQGTLAHLRSSALPRRTNPAEGLGRLTDSPATSRRRLYL